MMHDTMSGWERLEHVIEICWSARRVGDDACRHTAMIDVSSYPAETEVPSFRSRVVCAKCGSRGNKIDVRNWKEQPQPRLTGKVG